MYTILLIAAIIIVWFIVCFARTKNRRQEYQDAVESYVDEIFSSQSYRPEVNAGFAYGIPYFRLKFKSDQDKEHAISSGLTEQFIRSVQALCGELRPRGQAFTAERAVEIYSMEDEKRWAQKAAAFRKGKR